MPGRLRHRPGHHRGVRRGHRAPGWGGLRRRDHPSRRLLRHGGQPGRPAWPIWPCRGRSWSIRPPLRRPTAGSGSARPASPAQGFDQPFEVFSLDPRGLRSAGSGVGAGQGEASARRTVTPVRCGRCIDASSSHLAQFDGRPADRGHGPAGQAGSPTAPGRSRPVGTPPVRPGCGQPRQRRREVCARPIGRSDGVARWARGTRRGHQRRHPGGSRSLPTGWWPGSGRTDHRPPRSHERTGPWSRPRRPAPTRPRPAFEHLPVRQAPFQGNHGGRTIVDGADHLPPPGTSPPRPRRTGRSHWPRPARPSGPDGARRRRHPNLRTGSAHATGIGQVLEQCRQLRVLGGEVSDDGSMPEVKPNSETKEISVLSV